jgi:hypothetical protein
MLAMKFCLLQFLGYQGVARHNFASCEQPHIYDYRYRDPSYPARISERHQYLEEISEHKLEREAHPFTYVDGVSERTNVQDSA